MTIFRNFFLIFPAIICLASCIEDGFTSSPSDQPAFSVDTLDLGTIFTADPSPTSRFTLYNRHDKQLLISDISLAGRDADRFRLNVDGRTGHTFSNVDVRGKDSIFVFVEATLPETTSTTPDTYEATVNFTTNGVVQSVPVVARGQNVNRIRAVTLTEDTRFGATLPYQIYDSLVVAPGATLTIDPGTQLYFHDKARLIVRGSLRSQGTSEDPVVMEGDRRGNVVADISFEIMSRQWGGVFFTLTSTGNDLSHTIIKNTTDGLAIVGDGSLDGPRLTLTNCRLRNSGDLVLTAIHADVRAYGCEFAEGSNGLIYLQGGSSTFNHCTFANYYLFTALGGPAITFWHLTDKDDDESGLPRTAADFSNSIIYGNGSELSHSDLTGTAVYFRRCLLKSEGSDDDNFLSCLWAEDPLYYTERENYIFDYRLKEGSPAAQAAWPDLTAPEAATDFYGTPRVAPTALGAYAFTPAP